MFLLANNEIEWCISEQGCLEKLINTRVGINYAGGQPILRLIYQQADEIEITAYPVLDVAQSRQTNDSLHLVFSHTRSDRDDKHFAATIECQIINDEIHASLSLTNYEKDCEIREVFFPLIDSINLPDDHVLIVSNNGGQRFEDPRQAVRDCHSKYLASDHKFVQMATRYPGASASANCFVFAGQQAGLYFGSHDPTFQQTLHLFRVQRDQLSAGFVKYPFLKSGESCAWTGFVVSPYRGSWHTAADKYKHWADTWLTKHEVPSWVQTMSGWQRIIMKHQSGEQLYGYDDVVKMYQAGADVGINTLMLFGWNRAGHDADYPLYRFDDIQGGASRLRDQIHQVQKLGGKVHLYFNGQLIDCSTDWYHSAGHQLSIKDFRGNEAREFYQYGGEGTLSWNMGDRTFARGCPGSEPWFAVLRDLADRAMDLGVDTVFFDQLGSGGIMCCDPTHGHEVPCRGIGPQKSRILDRLRKHIKSRDKDVAIGIELLTDITAQHVDFVHNITGGCESYSNWRDGEKPKLSYYLDFFRYMFPEVLFSDREIRDDDDVPRRVNHALMLGLCSDVEVWRCRSTIDGAPQYREYLARANALRHKLAHLIIAGRYRDTIGFEIDNDEVEARCFESGDQRAIILTQSHLISATTNLQVAGFRYKTTEGLNAFEVFPSHEDQLNITIDRHGLVVAVFEKANTSVFIA